MRIDKPRQFYRLLKADLDLAECPMEDFYTHFQELFKGNGKQVPGLGELF